MMALREARRWRNEAIFSYGEPGRVQDESIRQHSDRMIISQNKNAHTFFPYFGSVFSLSLFGGKHRRFHRKKSIGIIAQTEMYRVNHHHMLACRDDDVADENWKNILTMMKYRKNFSRISPAKNKKKRHKNDWNSSFLTDLLRYARALHNTTAS